MEPPLSKWRQRIGYGVADFASNLVWQVITLYLMYFYTDVVGLSAVQVGTMFLVTRLVDGVADVLMGMLIDRTRSKWGRSRPWFLWGAIPYGLFAVACFYVPEGDATTKLWYAYASYPGLSLVYTMVNIPLTSILPSLTSDPQERTVLATTRILFSFAGATAVSLFTLRLVGLLGGASRSQGFLMTMAIFAVLGVFMFLFTFSSVRETVTPVAEGVSLRRALGSLAHNRPWHVFALNIIFMWGAYFFQQGALVYYVTYYIGRPDLCGVIAGIVAFVPIAGTFLTPVIASRMSKLRTFMLASIVNLAGLFLLLAAADRMTLFMVGAVVAALGFGLRQSIYFSMQADPVDFGEWKTGINAAGVLSATNGFIGKVAMASAGALSGWLLTSAHYVPNQAQVPEALAAIRLNFVGIPIVLVLLSMVTMSFYRIDNLYPTIRAELDRRRQASGR